MPRGASVTAEVVCFFRALETARPAPQRVLDDPYAVHFLGRSWRVALEHAVVQRAVLSRGPAVDLAFAGLQRFVAARHRFIDDALIDFLAKGGEQVVVLGAGFDTRALRLGEVLCERPLLEVDFPATQARKKRRLERAVSSGLIAKDAARHLTWLPIDFEHQTLEQGLLGLEPRAPRTGAFRPGLKTFFVWEGVSMYLSPATVELTLMTLARLSAPGSELALDLWSPAASKHPWALMRRWGSKTLALLGEPLRFSLTSERAAGYFARLGYVVTDHLDAPGLARRYGLVERSIFPDICVARLTLAEPPPLR